MNNPPNPVRSRPHPAPGGSAPNASHPPRAPPLNFHKPATQTRTHTPANRPYSVEETRRIQAQLNRVLGPEYVSCRPGGGGQNVSYIEGWKALNLANEIFGFNGWSSELISVQVDYLDSHGSGRVSLGLSVVVRITIRDGTFHEDFGYGNIDNAKNKAMAFEKCKKEAFTDALKRCLRCFGNVLGNCLYDKSIVAKMQKVKLPALELDWDDFHRDPLIVKRETDKQNKADAAAAALTPALSATGSSVSAMTSAPQTASTAVSVASHTGPTGANGNAKLPTKEPINMHTSAPNRPNNSVPQNRPVQQQSVANGAAPKAANGLTPSLVREYDLEDFDDLFVFSDDMPADAEPNELQEDLDLEKVSNAAADTPEPPADTTTKEQESTPNQVFFTSSKKALDVQNASYQNGIPVYDHKFIANSVKRTVDPSKSTKIRRADLPTVYTPSQINANQAASPAVLPGAPIGKRPLGLPPSQRPASKRLHRSAGEHTEKENATHSS